MTTTPNTATAVPARWATAPDLAESGCLQSHDLATVAGYVVTLTITGAGTVAVDPDTGRVGLDHSWHDGAASFVEALAAREALRADHGRKSWATVHTCYVCGCRAR